MEKFFLRAFFPNNKLHIVNHQHIHGTVFVPQQQPEKKVIYVTSEEFTNEVIDSIRNGNASAMTKLRDKYRTVDVLHKVDYDAWEELRGQFPDRAEADLKLNREFWARYDGRIAEVSNRVNDTYLKANGQKDGVKSYNRMVDLIVAYYYGGN